MTPPLVTVCVPTIGRIEMVRETWDSLQRQTYSNLEILVLDNGSDAAFGEDLRRMVDLDPRAKVLRIEERIPVFANFERGRRAARGAYLTYFHDDDIYHPSFLEAHVSALEGAPATAFSGCNCDYMDAEGHDLGARNLIERTAIWEGREFIERLLRLGRNPVAFQGVVWRRACVPEGLFTDANGPHYTDFVMMMRVAETAPVSMIAERLVRVRLHPAAASAVRASWGFPLLDQVLRDYLADARARGALDEDFVRRASTWVERAVRNAYMLGWLQAADAKEAAACATALDGGMSSRAASGVMRLVSALRLRPTVRRLILPSLLARLRRSKAAPVTPGRG